MKALQNIGCFLIGWDKNILSECGEASFRQYRKLLSAISIMMVLWGLSVTVLQTGTSI